MREDGLGLCCAVLGVAVAGAVDGLRAGEMGVRCGVVKGGYLGSDRGVFCVVWAC
jgi:hypothetical protein